jgi:hypothetical protein
MYRCYLDNSSHVNLVDLYILKSNVLLLFVISHNVWLAETEITISVNCSKNSYIDVSWTTADLDLIISKE